jgi:hypothetical protein
VMIWRSASVAACASQPGAFPGGKRVALRIATRAVEASLQSPLPLR